MHPAAELWSIGLARSKSVDAHGGIVIGWAVQSGLGGSVTPWISGGFNEGIITVY